MSQWEMMMLNLQPAKIPAGTVACGYCGKPVIQTTKRRMKMHCDAVCMRRAQIIKKAALRACT